MPDIEVQKVSSDYAQENFAVVRVKELPRLVRVEDDGTWEPQYALVFDRSVNPKSMAYYLRRDDMLKLAQALQRCFAPTPEDQLLAALERIEGQLKSPKPAT